MPKVSRETASNVANVGPTESRSEKPEPRGVEFSSAAAYRQTFEVLERNLAALQAS